MKTTFVFCLLLPVAFPARAEERKTSDMHSRVGGILAQWNRGDSPGCSLSIIKDGRVVLRKSVGSANLDYEVPNTSQTVFEIGSATKSFVCACLALLMDEGKISPTDEVRKYIPELAARKPPLRIEHLIRCRSGTWDHWHAVQLAGWKSEPIESPYSEADVLNLLCGQKRFPFAAGEKFKYGSGDYFLLGEVIHRATGKPLAQFAQQRLFAPLGMKRTFFEMDPTLVCKGRATGYYRGLDDRWHHWRTHGGGIGGWGLKTCVEDLVRWDAMFIGSPFPQGKYFDEFIQHGTLLENANVVDANAGKKYRGAKRVQFTGGMPGSLATLTRFPEHDLTVICLTNNSTEIRPWKIAERVADLYLFDGDARQNAQPEPAPAVELTEERLREFTSVWRAKYHFIFHVVFESGRLKFRHHFGKEYPMKPIGPSRFRIEDYPVEGAELVFRRENKDGPFTLHMEWPGGKEEYRPIQIVGASSEEITAYVGEFVSEELTAVYRFRERAGKLWLQVNGHSWEPLEPTVRDEFIPEKRGIHENRILRFHRNENDKAGRVSVSLWRVSNVVFQKRD